MNLKKGLSAVFNVLSGKRGQRAADYSRFSLGVGVLAAVATPAALITGGAGLAPAAVLLGLDAGVYALMAAGETRQHKREQAARQKTPKF